MRVAVVAEYLPAQRTIRSSASGLTARRWRRATPAQRSSVFVLAPLSRGRRGGKLRLARQRRCGARSTGSMFTTSATSRHPARGAMRQLGGAGRRRRSLARCAAPAPFDLIHAHNAVPAGDAALRAGDGRSRSSSRFTAATSLDGLARAAGRAHGGTRPRAARARARQQRGDRAAGADAWRTRHARRPSRHGPTVSRRAQPAAARSRPSRISSRASVTPTCMRAIVELPYVRYLVVGDGPERAPLERLAAELGLIADRVEFAGQLPHEAALARARTAWAFVMPSTDEAFGVAYVEAMAAGVPAVGSAGEPGPEEIAAAGEGIVLVPARRGHAPLRGTRRAARRRGAVRGARSRGAAKPSSASFTWRECGRADRRRVRGGPAVKPVLFVTGHVPASRRGAFERARRAAADSRSRCSVVPISTAPPRAPPPASVTYARWISARSAGSWRAASIPRVIVGTGGRVALPLAWRAARRSGLPFVFWAALWHTPSTPAHLAALRADAPHLSPRGRRRHLRPARQRLRRARTARCGSSIAPQAVDNAVLGGAHGAVSRRALRGGVRWSRGAREGHWGRARRVAARRTWRGGSRARARRTAFRRAAGRQRDPDVSTRPDCATFTLAPAFSS